MDNFKKALNYAFLLLKYRERSRFELISRFEKKGYSPSLIKKTTKYLEDNKYINDKIFTSNYILYSLQKGWGPEKIKYKLKKIGISDSLSAQELNDLDFSQNIKEIAVERLNYYQRLNSKLPIKAVLSRILRFLLSRGFDYEQIYEEIQSLKESNFENQ